jgi:excisionase family DNA binding protein
MTEFSDTATRAEVRDRLAVSPNEAARLAGVGRTKLYEAIGTGDLRSFKIGKRRLIMVDTLREWLAAAEREACDEG